VKREELVSVRNPTVSSPVHDLLAPAPLAQPQTPDVPHAPGEAQDCLRLLALEKGRKEGTRVFGVGGRDRQTRLSDLATCEQ
jgi:hypothetical protein